MAHRSDPTFQALHAVRLRGRAPTEAVGRSLDDPTLDVEALLRSAADDGHLVYREGRAAGWSLTPAGRATHAALLAAERDCCAVADIIGACYEQFLAVNQDLITVCTSWQVKADGSLNDHADASYDAEVVAALGGIDARVQPVCGRLAAAMVRFGAYGARLGAALDKVRGGDIQFFTSPACDSYHTVWFELHEDLLQTLGIERSTE